MDIFGSADSIIFSQTILDSLQDLIFCDKVLFILLIMSQKMSIVGTEIVWMFEVYVNFKTQLAQCVFKYGRQQT